MGLGVLPHMSEAANLKQPRPILFFFFFLNGPWWRPKGHPPPGRRLEFWRKWKKYRWEVPTTEGEANWFRSSESRQSIARSIKMKSEWRDQRSRIIKDFSLHWYVDSNCSGQPVQAETTWGFNSVVNKKNVQLPAAKSNFCLLICFILHKANQ